MLPLAPQSTATTDTLPLLVLAFVSDVHGDEGRVLEREIRSRVPQARVVYIDHRSAPVDAAGITALLPHAQHVIAAVYSVSQPGPAEANATSASGLSAEGSAGILRNILAAAPEKTAVLAMGSPYIILNFPTIRTYICTYSWLPTSEHSAARALFGEIQIQGKLPVTLPGIANRGTGLDRPAQHPQPTQPHR